MDKLNTPETRTRRDPDGLARLVEKVATEPGKSRVPEKEWNFKGCPASQLAYCQTYEYGRSSPAMIRRVHWWRQDGYAEADHRIISNYQLSAVQPMDLFRLFPEFPQEPWLSFPLEVIKQRLAMLPKREPILVRAVPVDKMRDFGDFQNIVHVLEAYQTTTIQPLEVNWFAPDTSLIAAFKEWLVANRPYPAKEKRGRTEPRVLLNALAAKRLLDDHSVSECDEITAERLGKPLFRGASNWYDAKAKAEAHLAERLPPIPVEKFAKNVGRLFDAGFTEDEVNLLWQHFKHLTVSDAKKALRPAGDEFVAGMRALLNKLTGK